MYVPVDVGMKSAPWNGNREVKKSVTGSQCHVGALLPKNGPSALTTSCLKKKKNNGSSVDNVHKALKLMRAVDIPPIGTSHNYSKNKIFGAVSTIPLKSIPDIRKSAHVSLHERRIKEHILTPYQTEILAKFDKAGPRKIEVELVAGIVAEEQRAIDFRRRAKKHAAMTKRAWEEVAVKTDQPATLLDLGENHQRSEDDLGSICTGMSFSTANISNLQEDLFDIEVNNVSHFEGQSEVLKKKKILSRTQSQVVRNRENHLKEEDERKRAKILGKKTRKVVKEEKNENAIKQQIWLHLVAHFARVQHWQLHIDKFRSRRQEIQVAKMRHWAVGHIIVWYRRYKLKRRMKDNAFVLAKISLCCAVYVRKCKVRKREAAVSMLIHFINSVNGSSVRTQKLYKFRSRVIKLQAVFGQFYKCQQARLKLLYLALQRELHLARLERNRVKNNRERVSVRAMKRTPFFGEAVQKLDDICSNLTLMIATRNVANNLKMMQFRQLQNETDTDKTSHRLHKLSMQSSGRGHYGQMLKRLLGNQRKRHILSQKGRSDNAQIRVMKHHQIDPAEVKAFLTSSNHAGPTYLVLNEEEEVRRRVYPPLILLTGQNGALQELRDIARSIVAEESEEKINFEIQRTLLKENNQDNYDYDF